MFSLTFLAVMDWFCTVLSKSGLHLAVRQSLKKLWVMTGNVLIITFSSLKNVPLHSPNPQPKLAATEPWGGISLMLQMVRGKLTLSEQCSTDLPRTEWESSLCLSSRSYTGSLPPTRCYRGHCWTCPCFLLPTLRAFSWALILRWGQRYPLLTPPMTIYTCYSSPFRYLPYPTSRVEFAWSITPLSNALVLQRVPPKYWRPE